MSEGPLNMMNSMSTKNNQLGRGADPYLRTDRLDFRAPTQADLGLLKAIFQDEKAMQYLGGAWTNEQVADRLQAWIDNWGTKSWCGVVVLHESGEAIGTASIHSSSVPNHPGHSISYMILTAHQRQGYAKEIARTLVAHAFEAMGAQKIVIDAEPATEPSNRIAKALGFTELGPIRFEHAGLHGQEKSMVLWELTPSQRP